MNAPGIRAEYHGGVRTNIFALLPEKIGRLLCIGYDVSATAAVAKGQFNAAHAGVIAREVKPSQASFVLDFEEEVDLGDIGAVAGVLGRHGPFDTILCLDTLDRIVDPWKLVGVLHEQMTPGGVLIANVLNVRHYSVLRALLVPQGWRYNTRGGLLDKAQLRFFAQRSAIDLMTSSGLQVDGYAFGAETEDSKASLLDRLTFGLLRDFLVYEYLIRVHRVGNRERAVLALPPAASNGAVAQLGER